MRHQKQKTRLNRSDSHRKATLSMLSKSLFLNQGIQTTLAKAKEAKKVAEKLITVAKKGDLAARRKIMGILQDKDVVTFLFDKIAPLFKERVGGYTRIIQLSTRRGDGAQMALLELTEKVKEEEKKPVKKETAVKKVETEKKETEETKTEDKNVKTHSPKKAGEKKEAKKGIFRKLFNRKTGM
ncbi:MAG: 50S ribosomal protein L17 [Candidatus Omnitrophica bacterium]|nr:50S ribosomal protein L17 [Candidatus Omnitrophota bacterium]